MTGNMTVEVFAKDHVVMTEDKSRDFTYAE